MDGAVQNLASVRELGCLDLREPAVIYWAHVVSENVDTLVEILTPGGPITLGTEEAAIQLDRLNRKTSPPSPGR